MAKSFNDLKKGNSLEELQNKLESLSDSGGGKKDFDAEFFYPERDKAGNAKAIFRFLPAGPHDDFPFVKVYSHIFQLPNGRWFSEMCPTTFGENCPVCDANRELWNSGQEANKAIVRKRKRKVQYYSNIYVLKDPTQPELENTIQPFRYGTSIWRMIEDKLSPPKNLDASDPTENLTKEEIEALGLESTGDDQVSVDVFDFWHGANFNFVIGKKDGQTSYLKSSFLKSTPLLGGDDDKLKELWENIPTLSKYDDRSKFKSYDEIKEKLTSALSGTAINSNIQDAINSTASYTGESASNNTVDSDADADPFGSNDDAESNEYGEESTTPDNFFENLANG